MPGPDKVGHVICDLKNGRTLPGKFEGSVDDSQIPTNHRLDVYKTPMKPVTLDISTGWPDFFPSTVWLYFEINLNVRVSECHVCLFFLRRMYILTQCTGYIQWTVGTHCTSTCNKKRDTQSLHFSMMIYLEFSGLKRSFFVSCRTSIVWSCVFFGAGRCMFAIPLNKATLHSQKLKKHQSNKKNKVFKATVHFVS